MRRLRTLLLSLTLIVTAGIGLGLPSGVLADLAYSTCPSFSQFQSDAEAISGTGTITFTAANCALTASGTITTQASSTVTINGNGLTLTGGTSSAPGLFDLIYAGNGGALTLDHTILAYGRYGILQNTGTVSLKESTVSGNGKDGINQGSGSLTLTNSTVSGNVDAGIYQASGTLTLTNSTVSGNGDDGINQGVSTITLTSSTISSNNRYGIYQASGTLTLTNSTVSDNGDDGINQGSSAINLTNSTVSGNGDVGIYQGTGTVTLTATLLADNTTKNCDTANNADQGYNLSTDNTCGFSATGSQNNVASADLHLGPLGNYGGLTPTIPLLSGSIAIDAIPLTSGCSVGESSDQRGVAQPQGSGCDSGAYEAVVFSTTSSPADTSALATDVSVTLSATVAIPTCPVPGNACPIVNEGTVTFSVTDSTNTSVGADVQGSVSSGTASAVFTPSTSLLPGTYTIIASYHDPNGIFGDSQETSTLTITSPPSTSLTSLFLFNLRHPSLDLYVASTGGARVFGIFIYQDGVVSLRKVRMQSLVVTGNTATLYGTANLPDGTPVTFQLDVCEGFVSGRARLRLSTGYDSGWQGVLIARISAPGTSR